MWNGLFLEATAIALAGRLLCAWGSPTESPTAPPQVVPGPRVSPIDEEPTQAGPLLPLAIEACRHGVDFGDGLDPLLRNMLGYEQGTPWKRLAREGDEGDVRSLFIPATHCAGRELVRQSAITLLLMRAFDAGIDASAWTAYYYKTSLSGKLVGVIYGIHGGGAPQFMNVGANDYRVKGEWEREKTFWLEHLPRDE